MGLFLSLGTEFFKFGVGKFISVAAEIHKGMYMNLKDIDNIIDKHQNGTSGKYGMFGVNLGVDLLEALRKYANKRNVSMAVIVKTLVINYLTEKGEYDAK
jgi:hypothetical protein